VPCQPKPTRPLSAASTMRLTGNLEILDELVTEDYLDHNPAPFPGLGPGREGLKQAFKIFGMLPRVTIRSKIRSPKAIR
jgi:hypothetical protein